MEVILGVKGLQHACAVVYSNVTAYCQCCYQWFHLAKRLSADFLRILFLKPQAFVSASFLLCNQMKSLPFIQGLNSGSYDFLQVIKEIISYLELIGYQHCSYSLIGFFLMKNKRSIDLLKILLYEIDLLAVGQIYSCVDFFFIF